MTMPYTCCREKLAQQYRPPQANSIQKQLPTAAEYLRSLACATAADAGFVLPSSGEDIANPEHGGVDDDGSGCELCGEFCRPEQLAACSHGHSICTYCLRSYVAYTHGLQACLCQTPAIHQLDAAAVAVGPATRTSACVQLGEPNWHPPGSVFRPTC